MAEQITYVCDLCGREKSRFEGSLCNKCEEWTDKARQTIFEISNDITDVKFTNNGWGLKMRITLMNSAQAESLAEEIKQQFYGREALHGFSSVDVMIIVPSPVDVSFKCNLSEIEAALEADGVEGEE